ncbi:helix-turn-helix transcriptional regulator [Paenibacillus dendritiformis]|uniref:helix-turn-helix transcriptional regulator n=1 Tax=Paenibacillus dendritiformis TaxID=130049 RepID=UPI00248BDC0E|nr:helix-turn-helix transcriptional regulator [Paenibacillus dendritiformis]WGU94413.1 helix-turn-helix transcriptional regulator [Paenibacillus dendritiformis]
MTIANRTARPFSPILHAISRTHYWKGHGALSIKTFRNGRAFYEAGQGHFAVDDNSYLVLNQGQEYAITIEAEQPVESFCVFFPDSVAEAVLHHLTVSDEQLLDDPFSPKRGTIEFVQRTYPHDQWVAPALRRMRAEYAARQGEPMWLEDKLHGLAQALLQVHLQVRRDILKLPARKSATRSELYKRVHTGHDYMSAYYDRPITLTDIARAACLSPNHFLRSYKQLFGRSPHQYIMEKRLQAAKQLLLHTEKSVTGICLEVGFHSPGSFSSLFSRRFGVPPSRLRTKR